MTVIALQLRDDGEIEMLADTRISGLTTSDFGPKIFSLQMRVFRPGLNGEMFHTRSLGFGYCGNVTMAVSIYNIVSVALGNMQSEKSAPTFLEVAEFIKKVTERVAFATLRDSSRGSHEPRGYLCHMFLVGGTRFGTQACLINPMVDEAGVKVVLRELKGDSRNIVTGSDAGRKNIGNLLAWMKARKVDSRGLWGAMELLVRLEPSKDVGGYIQAGRTVAGEFMQLPVRTVNVEEGSDNAIINICGYHFARETVGEADIVHILAGFPENNSEIVRAEKLFKREFKTNSTKEAFDDLSALIGSWS